jgi:hypothetical protein
MAKSKGKYHRTRLKAAHSLAELLSFLEKYPEHIEIVLSPAMTKIDGNPGALVIFRLRVDPDAPWTAAQQYMVQTRLFLQPKYVSTHMDSSHAARVNTDQNDILVRRWIQKVIHDISFILETALDLRADIAYQTLAGYLQVGMVPLNEAVKPYVLDAAQKNKLPSGFSLFERPQLMAGEKS